MIDLTKFCGSDPRFATPATIGGYTYATNGHIIVRIPAVEEFPPPAKFPDIEAISIPWDHDTLADWVPVPDLDEIEPTKCLLCKGTGRTDECPECEGEGEVHFGNSHNSYDCTCATCDGNTEIVGSKKACGGCGGSGQFVPNTMVTWQRGAASARYLHLIKNLQGSQLSTAGEETDCIRFRFDGGCGLLMPMKPSYSTQAKPYHRTGAKSE